MKILVVGDPHGKLPKKIPKKVDLILITGDIGRANLARKRFFENIKRERKGLSKLEKTLAFEKKIWQEIYSSSIKVAKYYSKFAPVYSLLGNVGTQTDFETKKEEKKLGIKLPYLRSGLENIRNFYLVKNRARNFNGLRIGFLDYFVDIAWIKEFKEKDKKRIKNAKKETEKAKRILKGFGDVNVLISHQPPYGFLDKISGKYGAPKSWWGKHAGSKVVLDYIKKKQPRYVFCGHIHEGKGRLEIFHRDVLENKTSKGKAKIGKTEVCNVGSEGDYVLLDID